MTRPGVPRYLFWSALVVLAGYLVGSATSSSWAPFLVGVVGGSVTAQVFLMPKFVDWLDKRWGA